jgi:hypothetical protein
MPRKKKARLARESNLALAWAASEARAQPQEFFLDDDFGHYDDDSEEELDSDSDSGSDSDSDSGPDSDEDDEDDGSQANDELWSKFWQSIVNAEKYKGLSRATFFRRQADERQRQKEMKGQTMLTAFFKKKEDDHEPILTAPRNVEDEVDVPKGPQKRFTVAGVEKTITMLAPYAEPKSAKAHELCNRKTLANLRWYRAIFFYFNLLLQYKKETEEEKQKTIGHQKKVGESNNIRVQASEEVAKLYLVFSDSRRTRKRSGSNLRRWAEKFYGSSEPLQIRAYASSKRVFMNDESFQYIAKKCLLQIEGEITLDKAKNRLEVRWLLCSTTTSAKYISCRSFASSSSTAKARQNAVVY